MATLHKAKSKHKETNNQVVLGTQPDSPLSDEAMARLAQLMSNSPSLISLGGTEWEIRALKPGTQWQIAEEACKMIKKEKMSMGDVIKEFASNLPSVARVITLALLNDKERIYGDEYQTVFDLLMWGNLNMDNWITLIVEILNLLDVDFFFASTNAVQTFRNQALGRKTQAAELYHPEQNTGK